MRPKDVCRRIERLGGAVVRQKGSHRMYAVAYGDGRVATTTVSMHTRELERGTLHGIQRQLEPAFGKGWLL